MLFFYPDRTHKDICTYVRTCACTCVHVCTHLQTFTHKEAFKSGLSHNSTVLEVTTRGDFPSSVHVVYKQNFILKPLDVRWTFATDLAKSHRICFA